MATRSAIAKDNGQKIIIILDGSAAMNMLWEGKTNKYNAASLLIAKLQDSMYRINKDVQFCLRVYGHLSPAKESNCSDSRLEVYPSQDNRSQVQMRLADIHPLGNASLGYALRQAANYDVEDTSQSYSAVLITSGDKYCNNDVCADITALRSKLKGKLYVLNFCTKESKPVDIPCTENTNIPDTIAMNTMINGICTSFKKASISNASTNTIGNYLLFISSYHAKNIELHYLTKEGYQPVHKNFVLPMASKENMPAGRYRVYYNISFTNKIQKRIKEFYLIKDKDNIIELD